VGTRSSVTFPLPVAIPPMLHTHVSLALRYAKGLSVVMISQAGFSVGASGLSLTRCVARLRIIYYFLFLDLKEVILPT
jgi:hypothetical protein